MLYKVSLPPFFQFIPVSVDLRAHVSRTIFGILAAVLCNFFLPFSTRKNYSRAHLYFSFVEWMSHLYSTLRQGIFASAERFSKLGLTTIFIERGIWSVERRVSLRRLGVVDERSSAGARLFQNFVISGRRRIYLIAETRA